MTHTQLNRGTPTTLVNASCALLLLALLLFGGSVFAATDIEEITAEGDITVEPVEPLSAQELGELIAPIALYPDDLLAIVLPAATYPVQIVQAARFLEARESESTLEPDESWDDSIIALLNYPEIITLLNDDLDWTWQLGEAVLIQEAELITAVSEFRERARLAGNLESDDHQIVAVDDEGAIEIKPADPEVIYVPYYEPEQVTVYQRRPVYHYYPRAYPLYYYPYASNYRFSTGYFWGVTSAFSIGWHTNSLHLHHYGYDSHPYYNYSYYDPFYSRFPHHWLSYSYSGYYNRHRNRHHNRRHHEGNHWQPDHDSAGSRPLNPGRDHRDWRDERRSDHELNNRRREHVVAERRSRRSQQREAHNTGSRIITSGTARSGVPGARNNRVATQQNRARVNARAAENRKAGVNRRNRDVRRSALTTQSRARDARIERSTQTPRRSGESRRQRNVAASETRIVAPARGRSRERTGRVATHQTRPARTRSAQTKPRRARSQAAQVPASVARQTRSAPRAARVPASTRVQRQSRESRTDNRVAGKRHVKGQRLSKRDGGRRGH